MRSQEHRLEAVLDVVSELFIPKVKLEPISKELSALDLFICYLMLDAWIGNTDRHAENWGIVVSFSDSNPQNWATDRENPANMAANKALHGTSP